MEGTNMLAPEKLKLYYHRSIMFCVLSVILQIIFIILIWGGKAFYFLVLLANLGMLLDGIGSIWYWLVLITICIPIFSFLGAKNICKLRGVNNCLEEKAHICIFILVAAHLVTAFVFIYDAIHNTHFNFH